MYRKFQIPEIYKLDFDKITEKPWITDKDKTSDYFNYGFTEETFVCYQKMVLARAEECEAHNSEKDPLK